MNNDKAEQPGGNILLVPVLTIEVTPDEDGWLRDSEAGKAIAGAACSVAGPAAIIVRGVLTGCAQSAAATLALPLHKATSITIYGRGSGMAQFMDSLRHAIKQEQTWQATAVRAE